MSNCLGLQGMLEKNISLNEATILRGGGSAQCCELTWGVTPLDALPQAWRVPDLLVAADVVYHRELFQLLLTCLKEFGKAVPQLLLLKALIAVVSCLAG